MQPYEQEGNDLIFETAHPRYNLLMLFHKFCTTFKFMTRQELQSISKQFDLDEIASFSLFLKLI